VNTAIPIYTKKVVTNPSIGITVVYMCGKTGKTTEYNIITKVRVW